jgi:hypothetical protein
LLVKLQERCTVWTLIWCVCILKCRTSRKVVMRYFYMDTSLPQLNDSPLTVSFKYCWWFSYFCHCKFIDWFDPCPLFISYLLDIVSIII